MLQPKGVFAVITPWNFPPAHPSVYYLVPGVATGNVMIWVPAPTTSLIASRMVESMLEGGLPEGAISLVTGDGAVVGDAVVTSPGTDAIAFTGSTETGETIARRGAGKPLLLECGGNDPTLVLEDANVDLAAERIGLGCYYNAGQVCTSTERTLVHGSVHDAFVEKLVSVTGAVRLGDPFDAATTMGPLNNEPNASKVDGHIEDAVRRGSKVLIGG